MKQCCERHREREREQADGEWTKESGSNFGGAFRQSERRVALGVRGQVEQTSDRFRGTEVRHDLREEGSSERWKHASVLPAQRRVESSRVKSRDDLDDSRLAEERTAGRGGRARGGSIKW